VAVAAAEAAAACTGAAFPFCPTCARVKPQPHIKAAIAENKNNFANRIKDGLTADKPGDNLRSFIQSTSNSLGANPNTNNLISPRQPGVHLRRRPAALKMCASSGSFWTQKARTAGTDRKTTTGQRRCLLLAEY